MKKNNIVRRSKKKYSETGITLLALVITIIVLLILAGITISAITGDNGIIGNAGQAKEETEIANEREIVEKATVQAMGNNKYGNIEESELQSELDKETGEGETNATDIGDEFEVIFVDSNRYYIVDKDGNVEGEYTINKDENPGDFTIGENGETLDGSEEHPYEISCIEDLVVLSNISRGKGNYIEKGEIKEAERNTFSGKNFILIQTLNFNSTVSYADLSIGWRYDEEEEAYVIDENSTQNLRDLLTDRNGVGFVPISENTGSGHLMFAGILDGQGFEIQNLYENRETGGGLFNTVYNATLKNLSLVNVYYECQGGAGITGVAFGSKLYNLCISGNINSSSSLGGIVGSVWGNIEIINCCNLANLQGNSVGGIINYDDINGNTIIVNCYNAGEISGGQYGNVSGIIGGAYNTGTRNIINTCSLGAISKPSGSSYNFYYVWGGATVSLDSCYYLDTIINENVVANENSIAFSKGDKTIIDKLNTYVEAHKNDYKDKGVTLYNWKLDSNGLPTFDKTT